MGIGTARGGRLACTEDFLQNGSNPLISTTIRRLIMFTLLDDTPVPTKVCVKCRQTLPLTDFGLTGGTSYRRTECRRCNRHLTTVRMVLRKNCPPVPVDHHCPICGLSEQDVRGFGGLNRGPWVLDHDHDTLQFRGWLCHKCNRSLGGFSSAAVLERAIAYLTTIRVGLIEATMNLLEDNPGAAQEHIDTAYLVLRSLTSRQPTDPK